MEPDKDSIIKMLITALKRDESEFADITDDTDLREHGLDSITSIETIVMLEEAYDINVDDDDLYIENFNTIGKIMTLLDKCMNN
ncbi:phosphopantetheine binding protein [Ruminiclostridium sufflavum DSM 19573]|uniref:Phosphopantetheine binding protein n=1 Tax=Ruminiclostridium sufflavum DSM 19573 TaxID=1121337 RepID=A0A318XQ18_9FIRM|nr:acyl carrier protein [Ruminiclostridium sufflavum]PYG88225.1 phosphopantetheine binding protein [Ruminiclostridium sufflavum DSM 19573]